MRALERFLLLQIIDQRWREHLYDMDYLREGIHLRGFAQIEPLVAYKNEAFELFRDLMNSIWGDFARMIFHVEVTVEGDEPGRPAPRRRPRARPARARARRPAADRNVTYSGGGGAAAGRDGDGRRGGRRRRRGRTPRPRSCRPPVEQRRVDETSRSGATTRAGAGRARSTRSATGPERLGPAATRSADLRVSDQQREQAAQALREHFAAGRLNEDELTERARARRTRPAPSRSLNALLADLPKLPVSPQQQKAELRERRASTCSAGCSRRPAAALVAVRRVHRASGWRAARTGSFWPVWVLLLTLIVLAPQRLAAVRPGARARRGASVTWSRRRSHDERRSHRDVASRRALLSRR